MANSSTESQYDILKLRAAMDDALEKANGFMSSKIVVTFEEVFTNMLMPIAEAMGVGKDFANRMIEIDGVQARLNGSRDVRDTDVNATGDDVVKLEPSRENLYYDSLTDILNRRFFDEHMRRLINTLSRSNSTLSLMMIDIDFLKNYNDVYGHSAGDACLKAVAGALSKSISRADDFVVRYGGDEFVVTLPNTEEEGAQMLAEKMLNNIRNLDISHEKNSAASVLTISMGLVTGKVRQKHRTDDFILYADELLYRSKQAGHNRYTAGRL